MEAFLVEMQFSYFFYAVLFFALVGRVVLCILEVEDQVTSWETRVKILPVLTREHYTSILHWV
jgi:hypothetical protein